MLGSFIFLSFFKRITSREDIVSQTEDTVGLEFIAINAIQSQTCCPEQTSISGQVGRCYYPMGFFWICGKLIEKMPLLKRLILKRGSLVSFLPLDRNTINHLDYSILFIQQLSGLIIPFLVMLMIAFICLLQETCNLPSLVFYVTAIIFADQIIRTGRKSINTREIGYFLYSLFAISLSFIPLLRNDYSASSSLTNAALIAFFICSLTIFQASQRYSQLFIATAVISCFFYWNAAVNFLTLIGISILILINIPSANFWEYLLCHFNNRIHDASWSMRRYGFFRYQLIDKLKGEMLKDFIGDLIKFNYARYGVGSTSAYYKFNFLSIFLVFRIYILIPIFIIYCKYIGLELNFDSIYIFLLAGIVPSFLCLLRPFQGYGGADVYVWGSISFVYVSFAILVNIASIKLTPANPLIDLMLIDSIFIVIRYLEGLYKQFSKLHSSLAKGENFLGDVFNLSRSQNGVHRDLSELFKFLQERYSIHEASERINIAWSQLHFQAISQFIEKNIKTNSNIQCLNYEPKMIDNRQYSFWNDLDPFFCTKASSIVQTYRPQLLLVDSARLPKKVWPNIIPYIYKHGKCLFKSNNILLFKLEW